MTEAFSAGLPTKRPPAEGCDPRRIVAEEAFVRDDGLIKVLKRHLKTVGFAAVCLVSAVVWCLLIYQSNRAKDPLEIVRRHFLFYPEYSHGVWRDGPCAGTQQTECREVTYATPVGNCGPVTFRWRVTASGDADAAWVYEGPTPNFDESKYPLYAILNPDSQFIDSPALGKPLPSACPRK